MSLKKIFRPTVHATVHEKPKLPYIVGPAVTGDNFFDREEIITKVVGLLGNDNENLLVLHGQRRIGKTSILKEIKSKHPFATYLSFDETQNSFKDRLTNLAKEIDCKNCEELKFDESYPDNKLVDKFVDWLKNLLDDDSDKKYLLLFDEFDAFHDDKHDDWEHIFSLVQKLSILNAERLNIVFAIGRYVGDYEKALALFRGAETIRVNTFTEKSCEELVNSGKKCLFLDSKAIKHIFGLTNGHPYITQALCKDVFSKCYDGAKYPLKLPIVTLADIDEVANKIASKEASIAGGIEWIWDGITPAMKIVASAFTKLLNENPKRRISYGELIECLKKSGVDPVIEELEFAPKSLIQSDFIEGNKDIGYSFKVELLRRWIFSTKELEQVLYDELPKIKQFALEHLKQGQEHLKNKAFDKAITEFKSAIRINPHYIEAIFGLADALEENGEWGQAENVLRTLHERFPDYAKGKIADLLLRRVEKPGIGEQEWVRLCEKILEVDPEHSKAIERRDNILMRWVEEAKEDGEYDKVAEYYRRMGNIPDYWKFRRKYLWNKYFAKSSIVALMIFIGVFFVLWFLWSEGSPVLIWAIMIFISGIFISNLIMVVYSRFKKGKPKRF